MHRYFDFARHGTSYRQEAVAGLTTFLTMAYIIIVNPTTYYRLDTAMMFRESVRKAVGDVINDIRTEKGLRVLSDEELRPDADKESAAS